MFLRDWGRFSRAVHAVRGCLDDDGAPARSEPKRRRPPGEFIAHGGRERKPRRGGRSAAIGVSGKAARQIPKGLSLRAGGLAIDRAIPKGHRGPVCAALPLPPRKASGSARCLCSLMGFQAQPPLGTHNRCHGPIGDGQVLRPYYYAQRVCLQYAEDWIRKEATNGLCCAAPTRQKRQERQDGAESDRILWGNDGAGRYGRSRRARETADKLRFRVRFPSRLYGRGKYSCIWVKAALYAGTETRLFPLRDMPEIARD